MAQTNEDDTYFPAIKGQSGRRMSLSALTETEDDVALYAEMQEQSLFPIKEDLSEWLNRLLGTNLTEETFFMELETGALLCALANYMENKKSGLHKSRKVSCRTSAQPMTWYARDNAANFLTWCQTFGVQPSCMFESDDLVLCRRPRSVILCLLEIARMAHRGFGIEPPHLVKIEGDIEEKEGELLKEERERGGNSLGKRIVIVEGGIAGDDAADGYASEECDGDNLEKSNEIKNMFIMEANLGELKIIENTGRDEHFAEKFYNFGKKNKTGANDQPGRVRRLNGHVKNKDADVRKRQEILSQKTADDDVDSGMSSGEGASRLLSAPFRKRKKSASSIDFEVKKMAKFYKCTEFVKRLEEGTYDVYGRTVLIRLLKGRHLMVRVGGGWDTLQHYLITHNPTKILHIKRSDFDPNCDEFLFAKGRYKRA